MRFIVFKSIDPSFDALAEILTHWGHEVQIQDRLLNLTAIQNLVDDFKPDLILLNNNDMISPAVRIDAPEVEHYLKVKNIPVAMWDYEHPDLAGGSILLNRWQLGTYPDFIYYFNVDSYWTEEYRKKHLSAEFLPFGVDERLQYFRPQESYQHLGHDLAYIGTAFTGRLENSIPNSSSDIVRFFAHKVSEQISIQTTTHLLANKEPQQQQRLYHLLHENLLPIYSLDFNDSIEMYQTFSDFASKMLNRIEKEIPAAHLDCWQLIRQRSQIGYSYCQVAVRLRDLLDSGIVVYGEGSWNKILSDYPRPIRRLSYEEMYNCWAFSKIIFCFTKRLFVNCVHERVLHILGVGGFPLIDRRGDIDILFSREEMATYRNFEEAKELISYFKSHETERKQLAENGRKRVFQNHTYRHRLKELVEKSIRHFGLSPIAYRNENELLPLKSDWLKTLDHPPKV